MKMELVLDENGHVKVQDGKPVYRYEDGKEVAFDAPGTVAAISRLNGEARNHRIKAEEFESKLKAYEGLDPEAARKALEIVGNLDAKKLVDLGEVERVKGETAKAYEERLASVQKQLEALTGERDALVNKLDQQTLGYSFAGSKFIAEKLAIPHDMAKAAFGGSFKIENGVPVGYNANGEKIYSRERPGEVASFDEALSLLVEAYPHRDSILKGSGASGGGAPGSGNGGAMGKTMSRTQFQALPPSKQMEHVKSGGKVVSD